MGSRYFADTRQCTGTPFVHHAYVYDRRTMRTVASCDHKHRRRGSKPGIVLAQECANRMLRRVLREAGPTGGDHADE